MPQALCEGSIAPVSSPQPPPPRSAAADPLALAGATVAGGRDVTSRHSWLPARGQATEKLCVHLSVSLRGRIDRAQRSLARYPEIASVLRSRNALMAYACHRLAAELQGLPRTAPTQPDLPHPDPTFAAAEGEHVTALEIAGLRPDDSLLPPWAINAPLYRLPWETDFAERRCQLTLRVPPSFAAHLRAQHSQLLAAPRRALRPELAAVFTFSELVALACHELCGLIEADTTP